MEPLSRTSLPATLMATMRDEILGGVRPPGSLLPSERDLAAGFDVNRTTVREALRDLEHLGLVERHQGRRYRVLDYRTHGAIGLLDALVHVDRNATVASCVDVIRMLYSTAIDLVIERATEADFDRLDERIAPLADAIASGSVDAVVASDTAFHRMLFHATHSIAMEMLLNNYSATLNLALGSAGAFGRRTAEAYLVARPAAAALPHRAFVNALRRRDRAAAHAIVERVIDAFRRMLS